MTKRIRPRLLAGTAAGLALAAGAAFAQQVPIFPYYQSLDPADFGAVFWIVPQTTVSTPNLVPGFSIVSGWPGGPIDNSAQFRNWGLDVEFSNSDNCAAQYYKVFSPIRGFVTGLGVCGTEPPGSTVTQFIGGTFSLEATDSNSYVIPVIAQGIITGSGGGAAMINSVGDDSPTLGFSTAASISGTTLTLGGTTTGSFNVGDWVSGTGVTAGSWIVAAVDATHYTLSYSSTAGPTAIADHQFLTGALTQVELDSFAFNNDTRSRNIIDGFFPNGAQSSVESFTVSGAAVGATLTAAITGTVLAGSPGTTSPSYTLIGGDDDIKGAAGLTAAINANSVLKAAGYIAHHVAGSNAVTLYFPTNNGTFANSVSFATTVTGGAGALTAALISSGADQRFGEGCVLFTGSVGHWQNCFESGNGAADFSLLNGLSTTTASATGTPSQAQKWYYTDNTSSSAIRVATQTAVSTNAGSTGVDMLFSNNSNQNTNLAASGGLKAGTTKNVADSSGNAYHQIGAVRAGSVTGNATTCSSINGNQTAGTCGNGQWMVYNQTLQFSNLYASAVAAPGTGNSIAVTLQLDGSDTALTCTISDANTSCTDASDKVSIALGHNVNWKFITSASASTATMRVSASLDNPAP